MKRFWKSAEAVAVKGGWEVRLDERPLRTPGRSAVVVPTERLARAIAEEWASAGETVDPRAMPLTGLANAATDRVAEDRAAFASGLARYAEADLACYRAEGPQTLVARQQRSWDALLGWARRRFDVDFAVTAGIVHVAQPQPTVERLAHEVAALDAFRLAGLSPLVTIGGSLVAALAVLEGALTPDEAWEATSIDERWQIEKWGADSEAEAALASRGRDFLVAARFLELLET
ncbi:ATP12 family protein [Sphingomonas sp.]|uniref:ATP12 family chaperone protein n=1 Tax=Sphingomonas sp. TaxID=28214 RepID=UPI00181D1682|nr:ATP12 family protein [Sphingomonas sp.]MBA3512010.1 ATPase [Sphingomonas sp.]